MNLVGLKLHYLEYLETEKSRSVKTIENYDRYLSRFFTFARVKKSSEITEEKIHEFRLYLNRQRGSMVEGQMKTMKQQTQNYHLIALRSFLQFLQKRGESSVLPERIKLTKAPERSLNLISKTEMNDLLTAPLLTNLEGKRDRAILELLVSTGMRISELCSLTIRDINPNCKELIVKGKGQKARSVFMSEATQRAIRNYLADRKDKQEALFIRYGKKAQVGKDPRISARTVQRLVKHYAIKIGITGKVTPHVIRHGFASDLINKGTNLSQVQSILGHTHIGTTKIYTHVTNISSPVTDKKFKARGKS